ncbi:unnamed protein product [Psylliodes chrysocephalus]|uniref:HAT C-terminal dimerisation domain-containing protein n=1 Tax=Psylliodes chrysocephalus TaxID=3402493 RepID=A0A9P0CTB4_9CUCU|nr:unnamed protein product [Psylliodes chrysocephala]
MLKFKNICKTQYYDIFSEKVKGNQNELLTKSALQSQCKDFENFEMDVLASFQISCSKNKDPVDDNSWKYEITKYLFEVANSSENVLNWWKSHETIFPILSNMARNLLALSATSALE